jgi:CheY-like chemotaxis protein
MDENDESPAGVSPRVLLAEDNEISQIATRRLLQRGGVDVDIACDGREAIERAAVTRYDAILMDCEMPEVDGFSAAQSIRAGNGPNRATPILAFTAHDTPDEQAKCLAAGMDEVIAKPLRVADLERVLGRASATVGPPGTSSDSAGDTYELIDLGVVGEVLSDGGWEAGLIETFLGQTETRLGRLRDAVARRDAVRAGAIAHSLKGSCATFGAVRMAAVAALIHDHDGERLLAQARLHLPWLQELLPFTREALQRAAVAAAGRHEDEAP